MNFLNYQGKNSGTYQGPNDKPMPVSLPQNERTHEEMEAQVDQTRFQTKASGVKLAKGE